MFGIQSKRRATYSGCIHPIKIVCVGAKRERKNKEKYIYIYFLTVKRQVSSCKADMRFLVSVILNFTKKVFELYTSSSPPLYPHVHDKENFAREEKGEGEMGKEE